MTGTIAIIGGGVAGLAAGCYAQMNGYASQIYELHSIPGGLCTSWKRRGYTFDGAIRYLSGTHPHSKIHQLWDELGALERTEIHYYDEFTRYIGRDGRALIVYTNIDRLEQHLLELSPQDADPIHELAGAVRDFTRMELPLDITPADPRELLDMGMQMMPVLLPALRWRNVTVRAFAERFRDPLLREALPEFFQFAPPNFPMMLLLSTLANMNDMEAGYPIGGSLRFAQGLARRYVELGGQIHCRARVERILVQDNRAVGVRLADGSEHRADRVISAADGHSTLFDLLNGEYLNEELLARYRTLPKSKSILQVALGVARDFAAEPPSVSFPLAQPLTLGGIPHERLVLKHYSLDPTLAPAGKSVLSVWCEASYGHWRDLKARSEPAYRAAKDEAAELVVSALEGRYPGLRDQVEAVDVATPLTYERYTANWRGAFAGWALTTTKMSMMMGGGMSKTLPGLDRFHMCGQWVEPGGNVELSAASGRDVIRDLCRLDARPFQAR